MIKIILKINKIFFRVNPSPNTRLICHNKNKIISSGLLDARVRPNQATELAEKKTNTRVTAWGSKIKLRVALTSNQSGSFANNSSQFRS